MNILSVLGFRAAGASRHGHAMAFLDRHRATAPGFSTHFELLKVVVASRDALLARRALLACPETAIVRCLPMHKIDKVELEIRFPAGQGEAVIDQILACLPNGEIGAIAACASLRASNFNGAQRHVF